MSMDFPFLGTNPKIEAFTDQCKKQEEKSDLNI